MVPLLGQSIWWHYRFKTWMDGLSPCSLYSLKNLLHHQITLPEHSKLSWLRAWRSDLCCDDWVTEGRNPAVYLYLPDRRRSCADGLVRHLDEVTNAVIPGSLRAGILLFTYLAGGGPKLMALSAILSKRPMLWYLGNWGQEPCCLSTWQAGVLCWWPRPPSWQRDPWGDDWVNEGRNPAVYLPGRWRSILMPRPPSWQRDLCCDTWVTEGKNPAVYLPGQWGF